jgi:6-pyruvoyltetrahydropterin/6-carboxytetrahydropterin synthase
MTYEVGIAMYFEAAHRLKWGKVFGLASSLHGHSYKVQAVVGGRLISKQGVLCDIAELKGALKKVLDTMDYKDLGNVEGLREINTTVESLKRYIHEKVVEQLKDNRRVEELKIVVWENASNYASFSDKV